jgi:hypothetical protein
VKKLLLLIVFIAAVAWWYFVGGRSLSEANVRDFYRAFEAATLERKPEDICSLFADDFRSTGTVAVGTQSRTDSQDKAETCESYRKLYQSWDQLGEKMGGTLQLDSNYEIHSIDIAADHKSATVDVSNSLDVAGSIMNIKGRSTDTLIRRNGKVLMLHSVGSGSIGGG